MVSIEQRKYRRKLIPLLINSSVLSIYLLSSKFTTDTTFGIELRRSFTFSTFSPHSLDMPISIHCHILSLSHIYTHNSLSMPVLSKEVTKNTCHLINNKLSTTTYYTITLIFEERHFSWEKLHLWEMFSKSITPRRKMFSKNLKIAEVVMTEF